MSVIIDYQGKVLLDCTNSIFCGLYWSINDFIEENNIFLNENIIILIQKLELGCGGIGLDIAQFLKNLEDILMFANLVKEGINRFDQEVHGLPENTKLILNNFYNKLPYLSSA